MKGASHQDADHLHLQEANLMFIFCIRHILLLSHHTEMVVHMSRIDSRISLRNQLGTPHVAVPFRSVVDGYFCALDSRVVRWVFEAGIQVHVACHIFGAMDVVLIRANLVSP